MKIKILHSGWSKTGEINFKIDGFYLVFKFLYSPIFVELFDILFKARKKSRRRPNL